jgi:hypothetical protein
MAILVKKIHITENNEYYFIHDDEGTTTFCRKDSLFATDLPLNSYEETIKTLCEYLLIRQAASVSPCKKEVG